MGKFKCLYHLDSIFFFPFSNSCILCRFALWQSLHQPYTQNQERNHTRQMLQPFRLFFHISRICIWCQLTWPCSSLKARVAADSPCSKEISMSQYWYRTELKVLFFFPLITEMAISRSSPSRGPEFPIIKHSLPRRLQLFAAARSMPTPDTMNRDNSCWLLLPAPRKQVKAAWTCTLQLCFWHSMDWEKMLSNLFPGFQKFYHIQCPEWCQNAIGSPEDSVNKQLCHQGPQQENSPAALSP